MPSALVKQMMEKISGNRKTRTCCPSIPNLLLMDRDADPVPQPELHRVSGLRRARSYDMRTLDEV